MQRRIYYRLRFDALPNFEKYFASQDELFAYLDTITPDVADSNSQAIMADIGQPRYIKLKPIVTTQEFKR